MQNLKESSFDSFSINHNISNSWTMKDFHIHDMYEIYFSLSDNVRCFVNDKVYSVEKGDLFLFTPSDLHKIVVPVGIEYERYFILFNPDYIVTLSTENTDLLKCFNDVKSKCIHMTKEQYPNLLNLLNRAIEYNTQEDYGSDLYRRIIFVEILLFINKFYKYEKIPSSANIQGSHEKIIPILNYIQKHLHEKISLDLLAQKFFISKYYLEHIFKKNTGFSVTEYIINKRIIVSKELLKSGLTVSEVSRQVGFNSDTHFIRTFKKRINISPKQYVKKVK